MNWYDTARASELKMAGRVAGAPQWKAPTFKNYVAPLIPNLQNYNPRKVRTLWEVGINLHQGLLKVKEQFLANLKRVYDIAVGTVKGNIRSYAEKAAQLAQAFLNSVTNPYGAKGKTGVGNLQAAFNAYVKPHLFQPMELQQWANSTTTVGRHGSVKNPMDERGYAGKTPATGEIRNDLAFRGVTKAWNAFRKAIASDVRRLPELGKAVADASNQLHQSPVQQQRRTLKRKDIYTEFVSPAWPEYFPDTSQGRTRFTNNLRPVNGDRADIIEWKQENKFLLHDAWNHPPYRMPDGSPSPQMQKFLTHLKNRPVTNPWGGRQGTPVQVKPDASTDAMGRPIQPLFPAQTQPAAPAVQPPTKRTRTSRTV